MENPKNLILVIFGASGDLASRKLIPALFSLKLQDLLPDRYSIFGVGRTKMSTEEFREKMNSAIVAHSEEKDPDAGQINDFTEALNYISMDYTVQHEYVKLKGNSSGI